ncbi:MAG: LamG domain-containing protein, partial [Anaerolineales bacterium]
GIHDVSPSLHTITANGDAQVDVIQSKFGDSSLSFGGAGDLSIPSSSDFSFGAGDFTVDFWVRFSSFYNYITMLSTTRGVGGWNMGSDSLQKFVFYVQGLGRILESAANAFAAINTWYHCAVVRNGTALTGYVDGSQVASATNSTNFTETVLSIGSLDHGGEYFTGRLDEVRISKGIARWTSNFTPPSDPYSEPRVLDRERVRQIYPINRVPPHAIVW